MNKMSKELSYHRQVQKALYDVIGDVVFEISIDEGEYYFKSVNPVFLQATGLESHQVEGQNVKNVIPPASISDVISNYDKAISEKRKVTWEETSVYPTGIKTGEVSVAPVFNGEGECVSLHGSVHDVTELRQQRDLIKENLKTISSMLS